MCCQRNIAFSIFLFAMMCNTFLDQKQPALAAVTGAFPVAVCPFPLVLSVSDLLFHETEKSANSCQNSSVMYILIQAPYNLCCEQRDICKEKSNYFTNKIICILTYKLSTHKTNHPKATLQMKVWKYSTKTQVNVSFKFSYGLLTMSNQ